MKKILLLLLFLVVCVATATSQNERPLFSPVGGNGEGAIWRGKNVSPDVFDAFLFSSRLTLDGYIGMYGVYKDENLSSAVEELHFFYKVINGRLHMRFQKQLFYADDGKTVLTEVALLGRHRAITITMGINRGTQYFMTEDNDFFVFY